METLQPKLRFPEFDKKLSKCKLSERMDIFRGASPRPQGDPRYYGGSVPRLMIQDATRDGKYVYPKIDFLTELGADKSRLLQKGSVVLSCSGTIVAIPTILGVNACIHDGWLGFKNLNNVDTEFLYYSFVKLHDIMQGSATTGGVFNNLTTTIIKDYEICFPSIQEQTKIANFLSSVDKKLNLLKEKKALLEEYKKGIMQKIFNQEIRFKDDNGNDFEDWEEKSLGECLDYEQPTNYLVSSTDYSDEFETPVLTAGKTFILGYTDEVNGIFKKENLPVIIFDDFTTATQFVNFPFKAKSSAMKILKAKENVNIKFVYEAMQNLKFEVGGHGRHWISIYSNLYISFPSLEEQTKIANFLSSIDEKIELVSNQIQDTQEYKKGLLQQMFV
jgi:type I restriction enzyme S subunit